jgi:ATP-dependent DNA helicase RecQ
LKYGIVFLSLINQDGILDMHPLRKKIAGRPTAKLYDVILEVINKNARGISGLDKPLHISASIIVRISESAPKTISDLKKINGMNNRLIERFGKPLVTAVKSLL